MILWRNKLNRPCFLYSDILQFYILTWGSPPLGTSKQPLYSAIYLYTYLRITPTRNKETTTVQCYLSIYLLEDYPHKEQVNNHCTVLSIYTLTWGLPPLGTSKQPLYSAIVSQLSIEMLFITKSTELDQELFCSKTLDFKDFW